MYPLYYFSLPHPPIPGIASTDNIFPFTHMCPQYMHHTHPPSPFPHLIFLLLPIPSTPASVLQTGPVLPSCSLILYKKRRRRNVTFLVCLTQEVSLWHFYVCMHYSPIWFISYFSSFYHTYEKGRVKEVN
jgi:hypothetical protein